MTVKKKIKFDRDTRRIQITQAALKIIASHGINGLTTAAISKKVGTSEANLYRHFKNKEEILYEMVKSIGSELNKNFENIFKTPGTPLLNIERVFIRHLDYIEKNEGIPRLIFSDEMHIGNVRLREMLLNTIMSYSEILESLVKEGQRVGKIRKDINARAAVSMLIGLIQASTMRWSLSGFSFSLVGEGNKLWKNYVKCIGVQ